MLDLILSRRVLDFSFFLAKAAIARFIVYNIVCVFEQVFIISILLIIKVLNLEKRLLMLAFKVALFKFISRKSKALRYRRDRVFSIILSILTLRLHILLITISLITYFIAKVLFKHR